jgi:hypothetical protein
MLQLSSLPQQVYPFAAVLALLALAFIVLFLVPGMMLRRKLGKVIRQLVATAAATQDLTPLFAHDQTFSHLWSEFKETLHKQTAVNAQGIDEVVALRATVPAETFFSTQALIDNRLRTEFFKHLPGIFTGVGIIGTFYGLISGLRLFHISPNQSVVLDSLNSLLHGVWEAFLVSALAIALAMVVTVLEKLLIASLYRKAEALSQLLDSRYESGAGEEYLSRLVRASEESAGQTKSLKDALVTDLRHVLREVTDRQIAAGSAGTAQLGAALVTGLETSLRGPLQKIAEATAGLRADQHAAVGTMLTDALAGFSQRMESLLGDQFANMDRLQRASVGAQDAMFAKFERIAASLERSATATENRQRALTDAMSASIATMQSMTSEAVTRMNTGAQSLQIAASDFATVGQCASSVLNQATDASAHLVQAATSVATATRSLDTTVGDYRATRDVLAQMVTELRAIVDAARKEASLSSDVVLRLEGAATKLARAEGEAEQYLDRVTEVLTQAHSTFADNMQRTLGTANRQFYEELSKATSLLREGIHELEVALVDVPSPRLN